MIDVVLLQEDSKDCSYCRGAKVQIGDKIARRASKVEGEANNDKGVDLKGLSVTQRIMSAHRKDKNKDMKRFGGLKGYTFRGSPSGQMVLV